MAEKKTHAKKETKVTEAKKTPVKEVSKGNDKSPVHGVMIALIAFQILLSILILFAVSGTASEDSDLNEKVTRLDNFFANNFEGYSDGAPVENQGGAGTGTGTQNQEVEVNLEGARVLGDENAPVTIVKYSDFRCDFCGKFEEETFPQIKENYIDTGLVKFVYKDFPVVGGVDAANAAWCAHEQGAFWDYKTGLFDLGQGMNDQSMTQLAVSLGLDEEQFTQCYSTNKYEDNMNAEAQEGQANGVTGTPAFVINGELIVGAQPYQVFEQTIESKLN